MTRDILKRMRYPNAVVDETDVDAAAVIVELEIRKQRHVGEHVLDEQCLAPAAVPDDEIRADAALVAKRAAHVGNPCTGVNRAVDVDRKGVTGELSARIGGVADLVHAHHLVLIRLSDEVNGVTSLIGERANDMPILPGKILVDEEVDHAAKLNAAARRRAVVVSTLASERIARLVAAALSGGASRLRSIGARLRSIGARLASLRRARRQRRRLRPS